MNIKRLKDVLTEISNISEQSPMITIYDENQKPINKEMTIGSIKKKYKDLLGRGVKKYFELPNGYFDIYLLKVW